MVGLINVQTDLACQGVKPNLRSVGWFCSLIFFLNVGLKFSQTDTDRVPPLLQPTAFGFSRLAWFFRSTMLTPN